MIYKLINEINPNYSAIEQILTNRGIALEDIPSYLGTTEDDINSFNLFGEENLKRAATALFSTIEAGDSALVVVDSDCDGYTSSALFINYLYDLVPQWVETKLKWIIHDGKQHGLSDLTIDSDIYKLVVCPDSSSEDYIYHKALTEQGLKVIVLDHHEAIMESEDAIVINNQLCDYPNKHLSGVGVTWQFCRYLDSVLGTDHSRQYLDLVALGLDADMMSLREKETKYLVQLGLQEENIRNPFIFSLAEKNRFSLGEKITPMGAAFYIAPYVNAMVRSGTQEEKELLFQSFLKFKAFQKILSTKRGHGLGELETLVTQAIRVCMNVKNRQTKSQDNMMDELEEQIQLNDMLQHKVLLFLLEENEYKNIAGLIANKLMAKYQRPCCILTKVEHDGEIFYEGSARGCDKTGINEFKDICAATGLPTFTQGHQGAFGLGLPASKIDEFLVATDEALKDTPEEAVYYVDYIYSGKEINGEHILEVAKLDSLWGKDLDEPYLAIEHLKVSKDMVSIYEKKDLTLKISLPNNVSVMLFKAPRDLCDKLKYDNPGYIEMNIVGRANKNEWNGRVSPQIFISEYEIVDSQLFYF